MLPTGSTDLLPAVLVQGVVQDHEDLQALCDQRFYQNSEEAIGHHVNAPLPFAQESVDRSEMPGFVQLHRKNHLADSVVAHGQHPADNKRHEDAKTGSTEADSEPKLVNPEWIWYVSFHLGVPPPHLFLPETGYARNASAFQAESEDTIQSNTTKNTKL